MNVAELIATSNLVIVPWSPLEPHNCLSRHFRSTEWLCRPAPTTKATRSEKPRQFPSW